MAEASMTAPRRRALVLANRLPFPLDDGWKVRTFHVTRGVAALAETTLAVFHPPGDDAVARFAEALGHGVRVVTVPPPRAYSVSRLALGLLSPLPIYVWNQQSFAYDRLVRRLARGERFDLAVAQLTCMAPYLRHLPAETATAVDTHNVDSLLLDRYAAVMSGPRRWYARATARKLDRLERATYRRADAVWVCSQDDRDVAADMAPDANVVVLPNGVDTETLCPDPTIAPEPEHVVFFGRLDYFPNQDGIEYLVRDILPPLKRLRPGLKVRLVGQGNGERLAELARAEPMLEVVGRVDEVRPVLAGAAAVIVPLRVGGGTRLKILEALSVGRPVISTTIGAEGIDLVPGRDILIADEPEAFARSVHEVLADRALADQLGRQGRAAVVARYDWRRIVASIAASVGWEQPAALVG